MIDRLQIFFARDLGISKSSTAFRSCILDGTSSAQHHRLLRHSIFVWNVGFSLTLHRGYDRCTHAKFLLDGHAGFMGIPLDLGRLPALRHFKFREPKHNVTLLNFLNQLLSTSTSSSGIETLEIDITYDDVDVGCGKDLFLSDAGWSRLDNLFTSEKFVSLQKVVLSLNLEIDEKEKLESERNLTLPYVNALFPMFRALADTQQADTRRTPEIHLKVTGPSRLF